SIIRSIGPKDLFDGLFTQLTSQNYLENQDSFEFPYDWRIDVQQATLELKNKIDEIKIARGINKINLVAHSMGGLVVKGYLKEYGGDSVDKFIDIGTPHIGAPKAFKILSYGDNMGVTFFFNLL